MKQKNKALLTIRLLILFIFVVGCKQKNEVIKATQKEFKIAFGSCASEKNELPIFYEIVKHTPDVFVFLGDNIYGDTKDMEIMKKKYQQLATKPSFQALKKETPIIATWDDHDYGWDDIGRHYPYKKESKEIFLDFFEEPENSERRKHEGIYTSYMYDVADKKVHIILLDERTFRDDIPEYKGEVKGDDRYFYDLDHGIQMSKDSTMLGKTQWAWLKKELQKEADIKIIGSGTQFGIEYNSYESWANFPHEQQKMLNLIKETKTNRVLFISGDVHYAEISKMEVPAGYPIYDITASGLSSTWHFATPNKNRIEGPVMENHFGMLTVNFDNEEAPFVRAEVFDTTGNQRIEHTISLRDLEIDN